MIIWRFVRLIYFNPRPREEGDRLLQRLEPHDYISIHALVKRATKAEEIIRKKQDISIHALVKRATIISKAKRGCHFISIHALVKRATYDFKITKTAPQDFNPRPREEGDCGIL